jgi:Na+/phosphate symporter
MRARRCAMTMPLPKLTPEALRNSLLGVGGHVIEMLRLTRDTFQKYSAASLQDISDIGRHVHHHEKRLTDHIAMQLREHPFSLGPAEHLAFVPAALERIGDSVEALARCIALLHREDISISEKGHTEVMDLFDRAIEMVEGVSAALHHGRFDALGQVREAGDTFQAYCNEISLRHQDRLLRGVCKPRASSVFLSMLDSFREIERYVHRMTTAIEKAITPP